MPASRIDARRNYFAAANGVAAAAQRLVCDALVDARAAAVAVHPILLSPSCAAWCAWLTRRRDGGDGERVGHGGGGGGGPEPHCSCHSPK